MTLLVNEVFSKADANLIAIPRDMESNLEMASYGDGKNSSMITPMNKSPSSDVIQSENNSTCFSWCICYSK